MLIVFLLAGYKPKIGTIALAQGASEWPRPEVLFDPGQAASHVGNVGTSLVADQTGAAHLVWLSSSSGTPDGSRDVYYYSRWDGERWTLPVDIFSATDELLLTFPVLVPTPDGRLHIFWTSLYFIMHSWAWAANADSARAWAAPEVVVAFSDVASGYIDAKLDALGDFHLVYALGIGNVYYTRSDAGGESWSLPTPVSSVGSGMTAGLPKLAVATDGRVHIVWTEWLAREGPDRSHGVYYAHSRDGGASWSRPAQLGGYATSDGNVLASGDQVYAAWNGGVNSPGGGRFLAQSRDGGVTWDQVAKFSLRNGQSGYPSMVLDGRGMLHLLTGDGEYARWRDTFSTTQLIRPDPDIRAERSRMTAVQGNQLVAIFPPDDGIVYFATCQLGIPAISTVLPASPTPPSDLLTSVTPATADVTPVPLTPSGLVGSSGVDPISSRGPTIPALVISTVSTLIMLGGIVGWQLVRKRH